MFRGISVLFMIEAHVSNSTILESIHQTKAFHYLDLFHGSISASFIFIAGFAFALTLEKKWDDFLSGKTVLFLQIRRLLFIVALGYWLHVPYWSWSKMTRLNENDLIRFLRADVLMCIAISLLISLLLALVIRNKKILVYFLAALGITIVLVTPPLYLIDARKYLPLWLADYVNNRYKSLFPLFSWSAYSFLGTFFGYVYLKIKESGKEKILFTVMGISGVIMIVSAFALFYVPWSYYAYTDVARASPRHFMMRLGMVFFMLTMTWLYEQKRKPEKSLMSILGQESLFIYGFHLLIVYGSQFTPHNLAADVGKTLTYLPSFALTLLVIIISSLLAVGWHYWKKNYPKSAKLSFYTLCAIYFAVFFIS
jgi:Acyltransferase family